MFATFWSVIGDIKNPNVTKIWRIMVTFLLLLAYGSGISFATWILKDTREIRLHYVTRADFNAKCDEIKDDFKDSCGEISNAVHQMRESNDRLRDALIRKFLPKSELDKHLNENRNKIYK